MSNDTQRDKNLVALLKLLLNRDKRMTQDRRGVITNNCQLVEVLAKLEVYPENADQDSDIPIHKQLGGKITYSIESMSDDDTLELTEMERPAIYNRMKIMDLFVKHGININKVAPFDRRRRKPWSPDQT